MIDRESILPLTLGAILALGIHLTALPGALVLWRQRAASASTHRAMEPQTSFPTPAAPAPAILSPSSRPAPPEDASLPNPARQNRPPTRPPPDSSPAVPPQARLGREDAPEIYRVGWISYDDFQRLIAPRSTTEQPALQSRMNPVPGAPLRGDPMTPSVLLPASPAVPGTQPPSPPEVLSLPLPPIPPPDSPDSPDSPETPQAPFLSSQVSASSETSSAQSIGGDRVESLALAPQTLVPLSNAEPEWSVLESPSLPSEAASHSPFSVPPAAPVGSGQIPAPPTVSAERASALPWTPPLVPDLRLVIRQDSSSPTTTSRSVTAQEDRHAADGQDPSLRPSSAPRSDRESSPVSLTDHPVKVRLQPGAVLVGRGVEIKTAMPRLSTVARFVIPHNARAKLTFDPSGQVIHARFLKSTGFETWDGPVLASLYQWRAAGRLFAEYPGPFELEIDLLFVRE